MTTPTKTPATAPASPAAPTRSAIDLYAPYDKRVATALGNKNLRTALSRSTIRLS